MTFLRNAAALTCLCVLVSACARPTPGAEFNDPYEAQNRAVHADNLALDTAVFGRGPKKGLPEPLGQGLTNFTSNLGMPAAVVNSVLQARPEPAVKDTLRFVINTTLGIGGLFDPATALGIEEESTDFGETLHVWGVPEGAFLMVPIAGPTTERDLAGSIVDLIIDPLGYVVDASGNTVIATISATSSVNNRLRYGDTIDAILYESADSYAQLRLIYLQNRRFELGIEEDVFDPYEDPYGQ